jgi:maleate isomerase
MQKMKRLGFLIPPGNPNTEGEIIKMSGSDYSVHFTRMVAFGETGSLSGQDERNQSQIDHLDENLALMSLVKPSVVAMAHTANSYTLGKAGEAGLVERLEKQFQLPFITAFGSVVTALRKIGVTNIAFGTPYSEQNTLRCKRLLEDYGFKVVSFGNLPGVNNIYDETSQRAGQLMVQVDSSGADAIFVSGVGMPTIEAIEQAEKNLGKPIVSSIAATMWNSLRIAGIPSNIQGYGSLLSGKFN